MDGGRAYAWSCLYMNMHMLCVDIVAVYVHVSVHVPMCRDIYEHMLHVSETYATEEPFEEQQKKANVHGYKWTELLRLPYFEPSRFVTVDPMHCLFLGMAHNTSAAGATEAYSMHRAPQLMRMYTRWCRCRSCQRFLVSNPQLLPRHVHGKLCAYVHVHVRVLVGGCACASECACPCYCTCPCPCEGVWLHRVAATQGVAAEGSRAHDAESLATAYQAHCQRVDHVDRGAVTGGDETDTDATRRREEGNSRLREFEAAGEACTCWMVSLCMR
jgi:hypothetical protein